jgi:hypothetical protein
MNYYLVDKLKVHYTVEGKNNQPYLYLKYTQKLKSNMLNHFLNKMDI